MGPTTKSWSFFADEGQSGTGSRISTSHGDIEILKQKPAIFMKKRHDSAAKTLKWASNANSWTEMTTWSYTHPMTSTRIEASWGSAQGFLAVYTANWSYVAIWCLVIDQTNNDVSLNAMPNTTLNPQQATVIILSYWTRFHATYVLRASMRYEKCLRRLSVNEIKCGREEGD